MLQTTKITRMKHINLFSVSMYIHISICLFKNFAFIYIHAIYFIWRSPSETCQIQFVKCGRREGRKNDDFEIYELVSAIFSFSSKCFEYSLCISSCLTHLYGMMDGYCISKFCFFISSLWICSCSGIWTFTCYHDYS